jgi:hypothetical protein
LNDRRVSFRSSVRKVFPRELNDPMVGFLGLARVASLRDLGRQKAEIKLNPRRRLHLAAVPAEGALAVAT